MSLAAAGVEAPPPLPPPWKQNLAVGILRPGADAKQPPPRNRIRTGKGAGADVPGYRAIDPVGYTAGDVGVGVAIVDHEHDAAPYVVHPARHGTVDTLLHTPRAHRRTLADDDLARYAKAV